MRNAWNLSLPSYATWCQSIRLDYKENLNLVVDLWLFLLFNISWLSVLFCKLSYGMTEVCPCWFFLLCSSWCGSCRRKHQDSVFANVNGFLKGHKSGSNTSAPLHLWFPDGFINSEDFCRGAHDPWFNWWLKSCLETELVNEQSWKTGTHRHF